MHLKLTITLPLISAKPLSKGYIAGILEPHIEKADD